VTARDTDISSPEAGQPTRSPTREGQPGRFATPLTPTNLSPAPLASAKTGPVRRTPVASNAPARTPRPDGSKHAPRTVIAAKRDQDPFQQIWQGMRQHLKVNYPTLCRQWFDELLPMGIAGGALEMRTRSILHRDYLRRQCNDAFNDAARTVSGRLLSVRFLGPEDPSAVPAPLVISASQVGPASIALPAGHSNGHLAEPAQTSANSHALPHNLAPREAARSAHSEPAPMSEARFPVEVLPPPTPRRSAVTVHEPGPKYETLVVNPDYSFEHFVIGPHNRLAHAAAKAVADNPGRAYNPFFVHGGVGLGKTHLLQAICLKIVENNPSAVLYYTSCEGFVTQYLESVANNEMAQFRHRFRDVDVLIIDDIHFLTKRDRSQEEFFHTFNALFQQQKQLILSSDAPPEEIPDLEERLISRFKWGLVAHIAQPDYETRTEILKNKARLRGLSMPDDVPAYIAQQIDKNIRELEGAITKLQLLSLVENAPISLDMARRAIGDRPKLDPQEPTIQALITAVTEHYGIRTSDLQSQSRHRSIALPRHICMYLARKCTRLSLEEIGGFFGGRDHTTVMHAVKTIEQRIADQRSADQLASNEPDFAALVRELELRARQTLQQSR
jgi:chromosomal replication initiator protein